MPLGSFRLNSIAKYIAPSAPPVSTRVSLANKVFNQTQLSTATSKLGSSSIVFDGADDFFQTYGFPTGTTLQGNLTVEAFVRFDILPKNQTLGGGSYMMLYSCSNEPYIYITNNASNNPQIQIALNGRYGTFTLTSTTIAVNTWYHVAAVRNNGTWKCYWDGVDMTTFNNDLNWQLLTGTEEPFESTITWGKFSDSRGSWDGYMDEIRISKTARYTGNFTPTTTPFVDDSNTLLLIHAEGANGQLFIEDSGAFRYAHSVSTIGNPVYSSTQSMFGGTSAYINAITGGSNNAIQISGEPIPDSTRWGQFSGYTIEAWVYHTAWQPVGANNTGEGSSSVWSISRGDGYVSNSFGFNEAGKITFTYATAGSYGNNTIQESTTTSGILNQWQHIAMVKNGTTVTLYVDGKSRASGTISSNPRYDDMGHSSITNRIGQHYWGGTLYIDEFRMSKTARYTGNFVPRPQAFYNDADTVLLLHFNGTAGGNVFTDDTTSTETSVAFGTLSNPGINQYLYYTNSADIAYLGNDSSSRPVFGYTYLDTVANGQYAKLTLFRVNSDGTTTNGSTYTVDNAGACYYPTIDSERDGFGLRTTSGFTDYGYLAWNRASHLRMKAFSYDLNALTATLGSELQCSVTTTGWVQMSYIGGSRAAFGYNGGNNGNYVQSNWVTRSGLTLTKNSTEVSLSGFGQGSSYRSLGMDNTGSTTQDGIVSIQASGNNGHGWNISANRINSTSMVGATATIPDALVYNSNFRIAQLNNSTRFISVGRAQFDANGYEIKTKAIAGTVTWNSGATAPTISVGASSTTVLWNSVDSYLIAEGATDGQAFMLYQDPGDGNKLKYTKLTVSTNTISVGEWKTLNTGAGVAYSFYQNASRTVTVGSDVYWVSALYQNSDASTRFLVIKNPT